MADAQSEIANYALEVVEDLKYLSCKTKGANCTKIEILTRQIAAACKYSSLSMMTSLFPRIVGVPRPAAGVPRPAAGVPRLPLVCLVLPLVCRSLPLVYQVLSLVCRLSPCPRLSLIMYSISVQMTLNFFVLSLS